MVDDAVIERVHKQRFDTFLKREYLEGIIMVKSDTEGHDLSVLKGAASALDAGAVEIWQFESLLSR